MRSLLTFRSEALRSYVVTATMAAVLVAVLGMSYALTSARLSPSSQPSRVEVNGLELQLPGSWRQVALESQYNNIGSAIEFVDPSVPHRRLVAGTVYTASTRSPASLLEPVMGLLLADGSADRGKRLSGILKFRVGRLEGARYAGMSQSPSQVTLHLLAVLTGDGHKSWVVYLTHTLDRRSLDPGLFRQNDQLLRQILSGTVRTPTRRPTATAPSSMRGFRFTLS